MLTHCFKSKQLIFSLLLLLFLFLFWNGERNYLPLHLSIKINWHKEEKEEAKVEERRRNNKTKYNLWWKWNRKRLIFCAIVHVCVFSTLVNHLSAHYFMIIYRLQHGIKRSFFSFFEISSKYYSLKKKK